MSSHSERNDARRGKNQRPGGRFPRRTEAVSDDWLWGWHAVAAALANPRRAQPRKLLATAERAREIERRFGPLPGLEVCDNHAIAQRLPQGAVHQGVAMQVEALESVELSDFAAEPGAVLVMLDQVTDPQNVGAILRSAAAFGARGLILQDRHAPKLAGALAKAAVGAVDAVPTAHVVNLSRALEALADAGWRAVGLDGSAEADLEDVLDGSPTVLVLGSEGEGLRRLVAEHCDALARIPMPGEFESLNVSAAAAVALYAASKIRP
ncbi:23S rRNA (guanosine(2251)-2'-O)-methyltransferase RlmB [Phenylobacterium sp.]|uniref:23S rRNA (guanosine(2251)-2'-O)-methyltransferase RlmB n=1 Tax=Phenylobacterium sp. TaxID=1871053 RepID=UPI0035B22D92